MRVPEGQERYVGYGGKCICFSHISRRRNDTELDKVCSCCVHGEERNVTVEKGAQTTCELLDQVKSSIAQTIFFLLPKSHRQLLDNADEVWPRVSLYRYKKEEAESLRGRIPKTKNVPLLQ